MLPGGPCIFPKWCLAKQVISYFSNFSKNMSLIIITTNLFIPYTSQGIQWLISFLRKISALRNEAYPQQYLDH